MGRVIEGDKSAIEKFQLASQSNAAGEAPTVVHLIWFFHGEDMGPVDEINPLLLTFPDCGIKHYNEPAVIGFPKEVGETPARADVDIAAENVSVCHCDGHPMGIHFSHRFCPFKVRYHYLE